MKAMNKFYFAALLAAFLLGTSARGMAVGVSYTSCFAFGDLPFPRA
jgi:hypothetical protein